MRAMRRNRVFVLFFSAAFAEGCGTVLPPLEEDGGPLPVEDGGPPGDGDDAASPEDDDGGDVSVSFDGAIDDSSTDACRNCADATREAAPSDVAADARPADTSGDMRSADTNGDARGADADAGSCPTTVDCAVAACNGVSCGVHGRVCRASMCVCPGGQTNETTCGDGNDNDCDGLIDCADTDCARLQCGASTNQRCCGTTCVNTETDSANCQGCGLACAAGQMCTRISDAAGTRGHCTCAGTTSQCPKYPSQVCRTGNNDGEDNLCACDLANTGNAGCAEGQVCVDVPGANYCRY
jgi:hypothetical protein